MGEVNEAADSNGRGEGSEQLDELVRAALQFGVLDGVERHGVVGLRSLEDGAEWRAEDDSIGTLHGHFAVFDRWTEINSFFEGNFMERVASGAFKKTFEENGKNIRCLFQHGRDGMVDMKPLGPVRELEEDDYGARYEVPLFDTSYNRDLIPALRANQYGASFRFQVMQEEVRSDPGVSEYNPKGIEERTIREMRVKEFGPVTFPAYADATAGVRSLTDAYLGVDTEIFRDQRPLLVATLTEFVEALRAGEQSAPPPAESAPPGDAQTAPPQRRPRHLPRAGRSGGRLGAAGTLKTTRTLKERPPWQL